MIENNNVSKNKGLGRGLGSLLGGSADLNATHRPLNIEKVTSQPSQKSVSEASATVQQSPSLAKPIVAEVSTEGRVWNLSIDKLTQGQFQPRKAFEKEKLEELAQSIREHGILQPIVARKLKSGKFEIIAGERRWRSAQLAGLHEVPVLIKEFSDKEALELSIIENIQREDLNQIEEAEGYFRLANEFGLSQQQISERVGKERATVANAIRLLALPSSIQKMIIDSSLSVGHAKVILSVPDTAKQLELAKKVLSEKLSVRKLEKLAQEMLAPKTETKEDLKSNVTQKLIAGLAEELQRLLSTKVEIDYKNSKGQVRLSFYSDEELTQLVDRLKLGCQKTT